MRKQIVHNLDKKQFTIWFTILFLLLTAEIIFTVLIPLMREYLFNGIGSKDYSMFLSGLLYFVIILVGFGICQGFKFYTGHRVGLIIRNSLTTVLEGAWYKQGNVNLDNPDQRISEDARLATEMAIEVFIELIVSFTIIVALVVQMSNNLTLLSMAFGYTAAVLLLTYIFHRPMINAEKNLQRREADFRLRLASVVLGNRNTDTSSEYQNVISRYLHYTKVLMGFTVFNRIQNSLMLVVPYLFLVPMFFEGDILLGGVMKGVAQFNLIVVNATILTLLYPRFTKAWASFERITEFYRRIQK